MKRTIFLATLLLLTGCSSAPEGPPIVCASAADSFHGDLAAKEVRRYLYLRTGSLLEIVPEFKSADNAIVLAEKNEAVVGELIDGGGAKKEEIDKLGPEEYLLRTLRDKDKQIHFVIGGDSLGMLYGAYRFIEHYGVRFYLHGDTVPDGTIPIEISDLDEHGKPLFKLRGIVPFHDFPEGPDWWTTEEWKSVIAQTTKMRMNFLGLHTYPEGSIGPEPTVWIGLPRDVNDDGTVDMADKYSWHSTRRRAEFGLYTPMRTSEFSFGGSEIFETDDYGPEIMQGEYPVPATPESAVDLINRTGEMLDELFDYAGALGIKTAVGTESPMKIPIECRRRLRKLGMTWKDRSTYEELYKGMFQRIMRAHPVDYYWLWDYEGQTKLDKVIEDVRNALDAADAVDADFTRAVSGWGRLASHFAELDEIFPKDVVFSCINMSVGNDPVSPQFKKIEGREKWAIPWFEDDKAITVPQLWVGRTRKDAADALEYGCSGLMGLLWRTRVLAPNIAALATASWDQTAWNMPEDDIYEETEEVVPLGGKIAVYLQNPIAKTNDDYLYQTVRYNLDGYRLNIPNGTYNVTLKFSEVAYNQGGKRVFAVELQGRRVLERFDIAGAAGLRTAHDVTFRNIEVTDGSLLIEFVKQVEYPAIAGLVVSGPGGTWKVNCGGDRYKDFMKDPKPVQRLRHLPAVDFYEDWALANFGPEVSEEIARIFSKIDGHLHRPTKWTKGPGVIIVTDRPWKKTSHRYTFVDELEELRSRVVGAGNIDRFDYWLNKFKYMKTLARLGHARGELDLVMAELEGERDLDERRKLAAGRALEMRKRLRDLLGEMYGYLLATLFNTSEMGVIANIEQQSMLRTKILTEHDDMLEEYLGAHLPEETRPWKEYRGDTRIAVLTRRTGITAGDALALQVIIMAQEKPEEASLHWRPLGGGRFSEVPLEHVDRSVYTVTLPESAVQSDMEWYIRAVDGGDGAEVVFPATAPELNHSVIVMKPHMDEGGA
jgi:hypothetical protein